MLQMLPHRRLWDTVCSRLGCAAMIETAHHVFVQCSMEATGVLPSIEPPQVGEPLFYRPPPFRLRCRTVRDLMLVSGIQQGGGGL